MRSQTGKIQRHNASDHGVAAMDDDNRKDADGNSRASHCYRDSRSRIERLLNYKRYIDWLISKELKNVDDKRGTSRASKVRRNA